MTAGQAHNVFSFVEFSTVHEAHAAARAEFDLRGKRIRVEPKEYSTRRHSRMPYGQSPARRGYRTIPWDPRSHGYPPQHAMPYGFQPAIGSQGPSANSPYNGRAPWSTPPQTDYQYRRFNSGDQYYAGSPRAHRYLHGPPGPMLPYRGPEAGGNQYGPPPHR